MGEDIIKNFFTSLNDIIDGVKQIESVEQIDGVYKCEHCGKELTHIDNELKVQYCTYCKKPILKCDTCPNYKKDIDCSLCPLNIIKTRALKEIEEEEQRQNVMSIQEFVAYLNKRTIDELIEGISFRDGTLDVDEYSVLHLKYSRELGGVICYEVDNSENNLSYFYKTSLLGFSDGLVRDIIYKILWEEWNSIILVDNMEY